MKHQKVVVNVWKMLSSSCSYLLLAFLVWLFLKLAYACFWFPQYLQAQPEDEAAEKLEKSMEKQAGEVSAEQIIEETEEDKKRV